VAHVGDSRCYIINENETLQVTKDHSQVQELLDAGLITAEEARSHPLRSVITRVVGYFPDVGLDIYHVALYEGDNVLCCSDGLGDMAPVEEISGLVKRRPMCSRPATNWWSWPTAGGADNISAVLCRPINCRPRDALAMQTAVKVTTSPDQGE
jgi:protein phosphatase